MGYEFNKNEEILLKKISYKGIIIALLIFVPSIIDLGVIAVKVGTFANTDATVFSIQDVLQLGIAIAFLLPLANFGKIIKTQGNDINELMQGMDMMIIGFKVIIVCLVLSAAVEILGMAL